MPTFTLVLLASAPTAALAGAKTVDAGYDHALGIRADGTVVGWGGDYTQGLVPALQNVVEIAAGSFHAMALQNDGTVTAWGAGDDPNDQPDNSHHNQAVVPEGLSRVTTIDAGAYHSVALKDDGTLVIWGINDETNQADHGQVRHTPDLTGVVQIAAGHSHTLALTDTGVLHAWGSNDYNESHVPTFSQPIRQIFAGDFVSAVILQDDSFVMWGAGDGVNSGYQARGQSLVPTDLLPVVDFASTGWSALVLQSDNTIRGWGTDPHGEVAGAVSFAADGAQNIVDIAHGVYFSLVLDGDGHLEIFGNNHKGQRVVPADTTFMTTSPGVSLPAQIPAPSAVLAGAALVIWPWRRHRQG